MSGNETSMKLKPAIDPRGVFELLKTKFNAELTPMGSRVTNNPPPTDTDEDWLVFVQGNAPEQTVAQLMEDLPNFEFVWEGATGHYQNVLRNTFTSFRHVGENINLIVTLNEGFRDKHKLATALCKKLNLPNKADRVAVFQAILYGNAPKEEEQ